MVIGRRIARGLVGVLLMVASLSGPGPMEARSCPPAPLSVRELLDLWNEGDVLGFAGYVNVAGRRCYGAGSIQVDGYVNDPPAIGYEQPFTVDPPWLTDAGLWLYGAARSHPEGVAAGPYYPIAWPGEGNRLQERYLHRWVSVRAHFDDPRARSCTAWDPTNIVDTTADLRRMCRSVLVIDSVSGLAGPDTATSDPETGPVRDVRWALLLAAMVGVVAWAARSRSIRRLR